MDSGYNLFTFGSSRKKLSSDHPLHGVMIKKRTYVTIPIQEFLKSLKAALHFLRNFAGKRILLLSTRSQEPIIDQMRKMRSENNFFYYFGHSWVNGFITNHRVVRANFEGSMSLRSQNRLKVYRRTYEGVSDLRGLPSLLIVLDGNSGNGAIREAISFGIPVIALRDTDASLSSKVLPIFTNNGDLRIKLMLLGFFHKILQRKREQL